MSLNLKQVPASLVINLHVVKRLQHFNHQVLSECIIVKGILSYQQEKYSQKSP